MGHLAKDGQHRSLGGLANRFVCRVGGARHRGGDEGRVDQLAWPAGELLGGAADDLAQDHTRVAAGAHQGRSRERVHELGPADLVHRLAVEAIEFLAHGVQGEHHVVAGIAVGDREHVQVVDLLAARRKLCCSSGDDAAESLYRGVSHLGARLPFPPGPDARPGQAALVTLSDFRQRAHT